MDKETPQSGWTLGTILALMDERDTRYEQRYQSQQENITAALAAAERAVAKSETAYDKRFDGVNEFRNALGDQSRLLMPRLEAEQLVKGVNEKVEGLETRLDKTDGRSGGIREWAGWLLALASIGWQVFKVH